MRLLILYLVLLTVSCCQAFNNLMRSLELDNARLKSLVKNEKGSTTNEVDHFDYIMDEMDVQIARTRTKLMNEDLLNFEYMKRATANYNLVLKTARCSAPSRKCLDVNKMEFGKGKEFIPNCAIVHKCDHDSGCCANPKLVCSPIKTETIDLYFHSIMHNNNWRGGVELLKFENHTECGCRQRQITPETCRCPRHFTPVWTSFECRCDCDKNIARACIKTKQGKRTYSNKGCKEKCAPPICDYGDFIADSRKCPRRKNRRRRRNMKSFN